MRCPGHPNAEVVGYCSVCGTFGCAQCIKTYQGNQLCPRHYRPIAQKIEEEKKHEESRKRRPRQRLVVRYADGNREYGVCFALNLKEPGFHLDLCDSEGTPLGKTNYVAFRDLKAVFLVKSFDGKYDRTVRYKDYTAEGDDLIARFKDGEVVKGHCLHRYDPEEPRFHLVPQDPTTNNISIVVEKRAIDTVYTPEEYRQVEEQEKTAKGADSAGLSQEETTGDFYFETRNYAGAMEQYRLATAKFPHVRRLQKKILMAQYNIGVNFIKRHEYDKALVCMETVLKGDPHNERVRKKVAQLRHIIEKGTRPDAAAEPGLQD
ncbi:MAG: hypothetical protein NTZ09_03975 [Candidatus Hydrogenedentes bacterium]|nr:hypothetical protein [Candidatus Hydrogenedentota bacterium]